MNTNFKFFTLLFLVLFSFTSCELDDVNTVVPIEQVQINPVVQLGGSNAMLVPENINQLPINHVKEYLIKFTGADGDLLEGYFFMPQNLRSTYNVVVLLHGSGGVLEGNNANTDTYTGKASIEDQYEDWIDDFLAEDYGVFLINSFKAAGRPPVNGNSYLSTTPDDDANFSPYRVRVEDVRRGILRLKGLTNDANDQFVDELALIGFSHGATTAISAVHDYNRTRNGGATPMQQWSVQSGGQAHATAAYGAPEGEATIMNDLQDVKAAVAYYGGTYGYGYFTDYGSNGNPYRYWSDKSLMIHHGTLDSAVEIAPASDRTTPLGFQDHILGGKKDGSADFTFKMWRGAHHRFDDPNFGGAQWQDTYARTHARTMSLDFINDHIAY